MYSSESRIFTLTASVALKIAEGGEFSWHEEKKRATCAREIVKEKKKRRKVTNISVHSLSYAHVYRLTERRIYILVTSCCCNCTQMVVTLICNRTGGEVREILSL